MVFHSLPAGGNGPESRLLHDRVPRQVPASLAEFDGRDGVPVSGRPPHDRRQRQLPGGRLGDRHRLSYRPRDAVPLNPASGCVAQGELLGRREALPVAPDDPLLAAAGQFGRLPEAARRPDRHADDRDGDHRLSGASQELRRIADFAWRASVGNEFNDLFATGALNTPGSAQERNTPAGSTSISTGFTTAPSFPGGRSIRGYSSGTASSAIRRT